MRLSKRAGNGTTRGKISTHHPFFPIPRADASHASCAQYARERITQDAVRKQNETKPKKTDRQTQPHTKDRSLSNEDARGWKEKLEGNCLSSGKYSNECVQVSECVCVRCQRKKTSDRDKARGKEKARKGAFLRKWTKLKTM